MNAVRGVTGKFNNFTTTDGRNWERKAFANAHQREINRIENVNRIVTRFGIGANPKRVNANKIAHELLHNRAFRKQFMLAIRY